MIVLTVPTSGDPYVERLPFVTPNLLDSWEELESVFEDSFRKAELSIPTGSGDVYVLYYGIKTVDGVAISRTVNENADLLLKDPTQPPVLGNTFVAVKTKEGHRDLTTRDGLLVALSLVLHQYGVTEQTRALRSLTKELTP